MELVALCADGISGSASLGFLAQSGPIKPLPVTEPVEGHGLALKAKPWRCKLDLVDL